MSPRTDTTSTAGAGGVFQRLGDFVVRRPWVVIGIWIAFAVVLPPLFPSLAVVIQNQPVTPLPADAPAIVANRQIAEAFPASGSDNMLLVLLTNEKGLGPADEDRYRTLVDRLTRDTHDVVMVQDFLGTPQLREALSSPDGKAWILPVGLSGELGAPESSAAYTRVADIVKHTVAGSTLTANLTGPAATVADFIAVNMRDQVRIEAAIITFLLVILLIVYRNPITMLLPLITIGVSLSVAGAVLAGASLLGLAVSSQTLIFLIGMLAGAGTDYAVFLISRYHDFLRLGADSDQAVKSALSSIGKVIAASAATVGVTFVGMYLRPNGTVFINRPGVGNWDRCGLPSRGDPAASHHRAHRPPSMDQATTRPHHSFLAAIWNTHCSPPQDQFGRQLDSAAYSGRLREPRPLHLRR